MRNKIFLAVYLVVEVHGVGHVVAELRGVEAVMAVDKWEQSIRRIDP